MTITEKCSCGASIELRDTGGFPTMEAVVQRWRAEHLHIEPGPFLPLPAPSYVPPSPPTMQPSPYMSGAPITWRVPLPGKDGIVMYEVRDTNASPVPFSIGAAGRTTQI